MSKLQQVLFGSVVGLTLVAGPAMARDHDWDRDHRRIERHMDRHDRMEHRDRYWREGYRGYVGHDRVYRALRRHHYTRWDGTPYWYRGHYVVRTYRHGHVVFVEVNPYTADFIGVIRF